MREVLSQHSVGVGREANLAGHPPRIKRTGHSTLQQNIGALQVTVQEPQGVQVLHPLRNVCQAQQAAHLHNAH